MRTSSGGAFCSIAEETFIVSPVRTCWLALDVADHDVAGRDAGPGDEADAPDRLELVVQGGQDAHRLGRGSTARMASSSRRTGNPKTATTASPMIFSMVPPCASKTSCISSK